MPCLGHVINLAVQSILGPRGLNDEPPENNDLYLDDDEDEEVAESSATPAKKMSTLQKLRKGIVKIKYVQMIVLMYANLMLRGLL